MMCEYYYWFLAIKIAIVVINAACCIYLAIDYKKFSDKGKFYCKGAFLSGFLATVFVCLIPACV